MIDPNRFGNTRPKLEQDDLEADAAVLTIAAVEEVEVEDKESATGKRLSLVLTFQETGDKALWLNVGQIKSLVERLGGDEKQWPGEKVPVEKVSTQFRNRTYNKVAVMEASEWDAAFKEAGIKPKATPARRVTAAPSRVGAVKKKGAKKR